MKHFTYKESVKFHGHSGPFLALGYKLGKYVMKKLKPKSIIDIECFLQIPETTPYTCIIDGIQCSTYCTYGKGNIKIIKVLKDTVKINFICRGKEIKFILKPYILERLLKTENSEKEVERVNRSSVKSLFEIEEI